MGRNARRLSRARYADECVERWLDFPGLPGRHLRCRRTGHQTYEFVDGHAVVAVLHGRWYRRWVPTRIETGGRTYDVRYPRFDNPSGLPWSLWLGSLVAPPAEVVDRSTGETVLFMVSRHWDLAERALVELEPDRGTLRFPVHGSRPEDTVLSAVDGRGTVHFRLRFASLPTWRWFELVELAVPTRGPVDPDVVIGATLVAGNMISYFRRSSPSV